MIILEKNKGRGKKVEREHSNASEKKEKREKERELDRNDLYIGVKTLLETDNHSIHLPQQKLFTLFSVALQYLVYCSTKTPGNYLVRVENSFLAEKLANKAKDESSRKFMQKLIVSRKLKYKDSTFYLDYFHLSSWGLTSIFTKNQIECALVVKDSYNRPLDEFIQPEIPNDIDLNYHTSLKDIANTTVIIAYGEKYEGFKSIHLPFINSAQDNLIVNGVTLSSSLSLKFDDDDDNDNTNNEQQYPSEKISLL
ncbi:MAG: hypothetical protein HQK49_01385 [Oligoflexia bacterium]|nr:hypothetical protein [Oligoflexia bacterium]